MTFRLHFDGTPAAAVGGFGFENIIDRDSITFIKNSKTRKRWVTIEPFPSWRGECVEEFADKTKTTRTWSTTFADNGVLQDGINDIFDTLASDNYVEWEYLQPEYGWLDVHPERDKDMHLICEAVFAAAGFGDDD